MLLTLFYQFGAIDVDHLDEVITSRTKIIFLEIPHFTQPLQNSSTPVGRDGVLDCHVENSKSFMVNLIIFVIDGIGQIKFHKLSTVVGCMASC